MQSESLVVPLLLKDKVQASKFIEQGCSSSSPTKLLSWGLDGAEQDTVDLVPGAAMGCDDGSVFLFSVGIVHKETDSVEPLPRKRGVSLHVALATQVPSTPSPTPSTTSSLKSPPRSRRTSYTAHAPHPLSHPTRSSVTSSVSKASVEAPKNYVDFDDEKEKLEDMIKGGPPVKDKSITDGLRASYGVAGLGFGKEDSGPSGGFQRNNKRLSFPRTSPSISGTPRDSLSSPPSRTSLSSIPNPEPSPTMPDLGRAVRLGFAPQLYLKSHVLPPRLGVGHDIVSMQRLSSGILVCLQKTGSVVVISIQSGLCLASLDLEQVPHLHPPPPPAPSTFTSIAVDRAIWAWQSLHATESPESITLLAMACDHASGNNDDVEARTRVAVMQLQRILPALDSGITARHGVLQKVGEWVMTSPVRMTGLLREGDTTSETTFFYASPEPSSKLVSHSLQIVPPAFVIAAPTLQSSPDALSSISSANLNPPTSTPLPNLPLSIPNPFKPKTSVKEDKMTTNDNILTPGRVILTHPTTLGSIPVLDSGGNIKGIQICATGTESARGVLWNDTNFIVFDSSASRPNAQTLASMSHPGLEFVERLEGNMFALHQTSRVDIYRVSVWETPHIEHVSSRIFSKQRHVETAVSSSLLLCSRPKPDSDGTKRQRLIYTPVGPAGYMAKNDHKTRDDLKARNAWSPATEEHRSVKQAHWVTSLLPLEIESIILGYSNGSVAISSLSDLLTIGWPSPRENNSGICGFISSLYTVKNHHTNQRMVVGGIDDGGFAVWDFPTLKIRARWTVFTEPLITVVSLKDEAVGRLQGCMLCVSKDGTLAVVSLDTLEFLYLIPGSAARLTRICLCEDNMLLVYADGGARLWDVRSQIFLRSMASKTAEELLRQGNWYKTEIDVDKREDNVTSLALVQRSFSSYDSASTLLLNIRALNDMMHPLPPSHFFRDPRRQDSGNRVRDQALAEISLSSKRASRRLRFLKALLGSLLSFGIDSTTDEICRDKLGISPSLAAVGMCSNDSAVALLDANGREIWQISPEHTASRLLTLVTVLRGLLVFDEECEQHANQVIAFYVASLHEAVGPLWQAPRLSYLARYWFHSSSEIRLAARALFGAAADLLSDDDTTRLVDYWQHELPCLQPDSEKQSAYSALALLIAGNIATERYTLLAASTLTDIAKSITLYLLDETCDHRSLAIDLCSRGFQIWQHYVDAMEVLRALFSLATSAEKERNAGPQARLAVLQIASSNTPLFMTTLSLDILHPRSVQQRKSIMQLVAFLIRKKPLVLYPNLPRLIEAVVKSLDPGSSGDRDAVFDAATEILGQVVKRFPSVDFHMTSQRLCVGTSEGAVIMYDLKTATRLYVLEGHKKRLGACSFSPDGRRLATVSLEESLVRVWKVGSSLTSLFTPGAPPRQGHAGSEPFKTLNFNVGGEANLTVVETLELVRFEWPADRTARLKIRDSTFTFNT